MPTVWSLGPGCTVEVVKASLARSDESLAQALCRTVASYSRIIESETIDTYTPMSQQRVMVVENYTIDQLMSCVDLKFKSTSEFMGMMK